MARIAVLSVDIPNAGRFVGDPMAIEEDGFDFESDSGFGVYFLVINVPGRSKKALHHVMHSLTRDAVSGDPEFDLPDRADRVVRLGPHRWSMDTNTVLPEPARLNRLKARLLAAGSTPINDWFTDRKSGKDLKP